MSGIRVVVTAEHIAACPVVPAEHDGFTTTHPEHLDPVELAIAETFGKPATCDQDEETEIATIGDGGTILVVNLPPEQAAWIDRYYKGEPVEPFEFDIAIDPWLVVALARDRQCGARGIDGNQKQRSCTDRYGHSDFHSATDSAGTPTGRALWRWADGDLVAERAGEAAAS